MAVGLRRRLNYTTLSCSTDGRGLSSCRRTSFCVWVPGAKLVDFVEEREGALTRERFHAPIRASESATPAAARMADALQHAVEDWIAALYTACGADSANAPKTETLDNTKHTAGCTTTALPGVAVAMVLLFLLKRTLCGESKLRKLYSGSEDAPEVCAAPSFSRITPFFAAQLRPLLFPVLPYYMHHTHSSRLLFFSFGCSLRKWQRWMEARLGGSTTTHSKRAGL